MQPRNQRNKGIILLLVGVRFTFAAQVHSNQPSPNLNFTQGTDALRAGNWTEAAKDLEAAARLQPRDAIIRFYLAQAYYLQGEIPAALSMIAEAARLAPANAEIAQKRGQYLADQGSPAGLEQLLRARKLDPALQDIEFDIGVAEFKLGRTADARSSFEAELQRNPTHVDANFFIAEVFSRLAKASSSKEHWTKAKGYYQQAIRRGAERGDVYYGLGRALIALREPADAIPVLKKAVSLDPSLLEAHFELAKAYHGMGDEKDRQYEIEVFKGAMDRRAWVDPVIAVRDAKSQRVWRELKPLAGVGDEPALIARLKQLDAENVWLAAGAVYCAMSKPNQAISALQRGLAAEPANAPMHAWMGLALIQLPNAPGAEAELQHALKLDSSNRTALLGLGLLRYSQGRWKEATEYLEDSRSKQPEALLKLRDAYLRQGEQEKARVTTELLRTFAPHDPN